MQADRRTVSYIDDSECVHVFDPMHMDQETEELLDQEWLQFEREQRMKAQAPELRKCG